MASSSPADYSNLHLHFLFGEGCHNCSVFTRESGPYSKLKQALAELASISMKLTRFAGIEVSKVESRANFNANF